MMPTMNQKALLTVTIYLGDPTLAIQQITLTQRAARSSRRNTGNALLGFSRQSLSASGGFSVGYQSKTYSLSDEVIEELERRVSEMASERGERLASPNRVLTELFFPRGLPVRLVAGESVDITPLSWKSDPPPKPVQGTYTVDHEKKSATVNLTSESFDPAIIPGVQKGVSAAQFPCCCVHTGCKGSKFLGASKTANLCPECAENGHRGEPRSCQECFNDQGAP